MYQYSNDPAFVELKKEYSTVNVVDVGAARAAFIVELNKFYKQNEIHSLGIDPLNHGVESYYNTFCNVCVDDIPQGTKEKATFYVRGEDQSSSLCGLCDDNLSSNPFEVNKYYMDLNVLNKVKQITSVVDIDVVNITDLINKEFGENFIHFVKIDCEGKDMDIVQSLIPIFNRIKYIAVECPNEIQRYKGEMILKNCVSYFDKHNFEVFFHKNYENDPENGSKMSDIIFVNKAIK